MWNKKEMSQLDAMLTRVPLTLTLTFDLEFQGQIVSRESAAGMGGRIVMEWKGRESIAHACPDVKHNHFVTLRRRILLGTGVT